MSLAFYGHEELHVKLRLLTVLELLTFPQYYDKDRVNFKDLIRDVRIVTGSYNEILKDAITPGGYSSMLHLYALSAALNMQFRSYLPPLSVNDYLTEPFS